MNTQIHSVGDTTGQTFSASKIPENKSKRSVFMATTALWDIDPHFFQCCLKAQQALLVKSLTGQGVINGRFPELYAGESPVGRSRNSLTAQFLKSDCTDILFIDSDLLFDAAQIERIVQHEEDVVGGCYMLKKQGTPRICNNPKAGVTQTRPDGLMEVSYIGTGFLRIRRSVFERMIEAFGHEIWYKTDEGQKDEEKQYDFWKMGVYEYPDKTRRWLSEDWWFCQRCQDLGIKVYADLNILLGHSGHAIYPLDTQLDFLYPQLKGKDSNNSFKEVFFGEYATDLTEAPKTVLDIGANEGAFTAWALKMWPECLVNAYEPIPENASYFRKNHKGSERVSLHQLAVMDEFSAEMFYGKNNGGECSLYDLGEQSDRSVTVYGFPAKDIPAHEFIKIDAEGCEVEILKGLDLSQAKLVICEFHREEDVQKIKDICAAKGMSLREFKPKNERRGIISFQPTPKGCAVAAGEGENPHSSLPANRIVGDIHEAEVYH